MFWHNNLYLYKDNKSNIMKSQGVHDCLKYWRVIRYFIKRKYSLSTADLDMLLFLYTEDIFSKQQFLDYEDLLSWDRHRFKRLLDNGWVEIFRPKTKRLNTMYSVTYKTQRMIDSLYKKLSGEEIPTSQTSNPIFAKNVSFSDEVYKNMIKEMNKSIKQQRRLSPE
tara:strand:- start:958 stop:1455 length:498 start_codon:yes stop_codon:yes gene_type:complete